MISEESIANEVERIERGQGNSNDMLVDTGRSIEDLRPDFHGRMDQLMSTIDGSSDASTNVGSGRVHELMYIGIMAAAMAILLVVIATATGFRAFC